MACAAVTIVLAAPQVAAGGSEGIETVIVPAAAAATTPAMYVPTSAHLTGAAGTYWLTDLEVHNIGPGQLDFEVALLKRDTANTSPLTQSFTLGPNQSRRFEDPLQAIFGFTGAAALRITPLTPQSAPDGNDQAGPTGAAGKLHVTSRTYNDPSRRASGLGIPVPLPDAVVVDGGTYGQFVPGFWDYAAISYLSEGRIIELTHTAGTSATGFRTNIGAVNTTDQPITIEIELFLANGTSLGKVELALRAFEYKQIDRIFERVTQQNVTDGFAILRLKNEPGSFLAYASVIDNRTGDPIYIPAASFPRTGMPPAFANLIFGTAVDANYTITNPGTAFPAGTTKVYVSWEYRFFEPGDTYTSAWFQNGMPWWSPTTHTAYGSSGRVVTSREMSAGFANGTYRIELAHQGTVKLSGQFTIGP